MTRGAKFVVALFALLLVSLGLQGAAPQASDPLPNHVVGGYWPDWSTHRLRSLPAKYNVVYVFAATPVGGTPGTTGAVAFHPDEIPRNLVRDDIAFLRERDTRVLLSIGGALHYVHINTDARRRNLFDSIVKLQKELGPFDGIDWNLETISLPQYKLPIDQIVKLSLQLKERYGQGFIISVPPAPTFDPDKTLVRELVKADAVDLVSPQLYDDPTITTVPVALNVIDSWSGVIGDDSKLAPAFSHMRAGRPSDAIIPIDEQKQLWAEASERHTLRGSITWNTDLDRSSGYKFLREMGELVSQ